MTIITAREFNHNPSAAKRRASAEVVFITDRGEASHVLMSIQRYNDLIGSHVSLADALALDAADDFDFEPVPFEFVPNIPNLED